jgi:putative glycosyltransferase
LRLSIVSTLYNSAPYLEEFHRRAMAAAEQVTADVEMILVNDGSPDDALEVAIGLHRRDPRVTVVDLSRNFGHHRAMMAGLSYAKGDLVLLIDCDLEEPPELLPDLYRRMQAEHCDVVYGIRTNKRAHVGFELTANAFYWLIARTGGIDLPRNLLTLRLMTQRYVANLTRHQEREVLIAGLWAITGFKQVPFEVAKLAAPHRTNYSVRARMKMTVDYLTAFSPDLLYYIFYCGLGLFLLSSTWLAALVLRRLFGGPSLEGWLSLIVSIWMFGGLTVLLIGLIGIYVAHIFNETKARPYVIVREIISSQRTTSPITDATAAEPPGQAGNTGQGR